jgi:archaellum component FlaF (FlaF/FlaG flagellin family)
VPFISCISNITYAHKYQDYISLYAQITEQTKTYISNLVEQKNDDLKPSYIEEVNTKEFDLSINVSITILKNGKRSFDINETNYKWFISYVENEGNIFISYRSEDILFTKEEIKENIFSGKVCSYCQCETKVVTNNGIYGPTFIQCSMNPDHYVGTYQSGIALGRLADRSLRQKITVAHSIFNSLLEKKIFKSHEDAYAWLSNVMKLSEKETDFWLFNEEQSDNAIRIITRYKRRKKLIQSFFNFFKKE